MNEEVVLQGEVAPVIYAPLRKGQQNFVILEAHVLTRKKTVYGVLYILEDRTEASGQCFLYTDENRHAISCSCTHRVPHRLCPHIKFIERTRKAIPYPKYPLAESRMIETSLEVTTDE